MKKKIIIVSNFNLRMNAHPEVTIFDESWISYRIDIFMNYTLKSLLNQTNQNFIHLLLYDSSTEDIINKCLLKYPMLPTNINFIRKEYLSKKINNLIIGYDCLYMVRIDADDMFHYTFIEQLHNYQHQEATQVLINQKGYIYDISSNKIANWFYYSPPFYTLIYGVKEYLNGKRYHFPGGHKDAFKLRYELLGSENFIVTVHGENTETKFFSIFNKGLIDDINIKNSILKDFGIY